MTFLRVSLPTSLTHGNIPEVPPAPIADFLLIGCLIAMGLMVNWLLNSNIGKQLTDQRNSPLLLRGINWLGLIFIAFALVGISLVVNEGKFNDLMQASLMVAQWGSIILTLVDLMFTLRRNNANWYRWALLFQLMTIMCFWLNLWISPA
ncbi:hypothetical protein MOO44_00660 (plasmid) [Nicoliella spurrieriana]|uniref:Uncharacterized protein n=1 Tax=Nicoliella spurrieriana TaxID=2925830 RepID=A0A976RQZ9_9LACO|nr:hypothetical protein [Nicoliella spurrieriana]UQS86184.1 hypothetical protein MOO44_00660 [Nicoliella spurrieriana]